MGRISFAWLLAFSTLTAPAYALAQDEEEEEAEETSEEEGSEEGEDEGEGEGEGDEGEGEGEGEAEGDAASPRSWYFGPYLRYAVLPSFFLKLGLAEAPSIANVAFGVTATYRSVDGPSLELGIGYTPFAFDGPVRADGDPVFDTEWIESELSMIHLTGSVLWNVDIVDKLQFEYGIGLDLGILTGDVTRSEAYRTANGGFARCAAPDPFGPNMAYCETPTNFSAGTDAYDEDGAHYGVNEERIPPIGANLMLPHLALRWEPIPDFAAKLEAALGFPTFFIGLSAAYGPEL